MRNISSKRFFLVLFLIHTALNLSGCSKKISKKGKLSVGISTIPSTLDPRFALDSEGMKIGNLIFQSLVKIGPNMDVIGDASSSWALEIKAEEPKYLLNFKMKPNLKFSDGSDITCSDILFSIDEFRSEKSPFKSAFSSIKKTKCEKDMVTIYFDSYSEKVLNSDLPVIKIMPKKLILDRPDFFKKNLIGSGPFKIKDIKETSIALTPNSFSTEKPKIKNLVFKIIKDDFTRFLKMYKGDIDLTISSIPKNKVIFLEKVERLKVIRKPGLKMVYLLMNFKNKGLDQFENRKLLFHAIDRDEIIKYKLEGLGEKATSILTPANPYHFKELQKVAFDFLSKNQLKEKILKSDIAKNVLILKTSNTREAVENAKLITKQLRQNGFKIKHESFEWGTYYKDIQSGGFDLATMTWVGAYDPDIYRIALLSTETPPSGRNRGYYSNSEFDPLVIKGAKELDPDLRKDLYNKAQMIAYKDLAIIPLWYEDTVTVLDKRIKNYEVSLNGDYSGLIGADLDE